MRYEIGYNPETCCGEMFECLRQKYIYRGNTLEAVFATWGDPEYVPIHFCPFCGEKIEVSEKP